MTEEKQPIEGVIEEAPPVPELTPEEKRKQAQANNFVIGAQNRHLRLPQGLGENKRGR